MSVELVLPQCRTHAVDSLKNDEDSDTPGSDTHCLQTSHFANQRTKEPLFRQPILNKPLVGTLMTISTAGLREQNINVTQSLLGILESSPYFFLLSNISIFLWTHDLLVWH